jgi:HAD superfamily hydrolase (TIGR02253 family)
MIKAVIFDLDNTLIDFLKINRLSLEQAADAMIDAGLKKSRKATLESLFKISKRFGFEHPEIFQIFLKKAEGTIDYRKLAYAIIAFRRIRDGFLFPYLGTKQTLIKLKEMNLKLAIVSDAPRLKAWMRLSSMRIDDFFDTVVAFEDTGHFKPSQEPFLAALNVLQLKPEECLMVGDNLGRDVKGAKILGMKTCFALYGNVKRRIFGERADYMIRYISQLPELVDFVNKKSQDQC